MNAKDKSLCKIFKKKKFKLSESFEASPYERKKGDEIYMKCSFIKKKSFHVLSLYISTAYMHELEREKVRRCSL